MSTGARCWCASRPPGARRAQATGATNQQQRLLLARRQAGAIVARRCGAGVRLSADNEVGDKRGDAVHAAAGGNGVSLRPVQRRACHMEAARDEHDEGEKGHLTGVVEHYEQRIVHSVVAQNAATTCNGRIQHEFHLHQHHAQEQRGHHRDACVERPANCGLRGGSSTDGLALGLRATCRRCVRARTRTVRRNRRPSATQPHRADQRTICA